MMIELPGYEDIFEHFKQEYADSVMSVPESEMVDARRRWDWLDEFKRSLDNFNTGENS